MSVCSTLLLMNHLTPPLTVFLLKAWESCVSWYWKQQSSPLAVIFRFNLLVWVKLQKHVSAGGQTSGLVSTDRCSAEIIMTINKTIIWGSEIKPISHHHRCILGVYIICILWYLQPYFHLPLSAASTLKRGWRWRLSVCASARPEAWYNLTLNLL